MHEAIQREFDKFIKVIKSDQLKTVIHYFIQLSRQIIEESQYRMKVAKSAIIENYWVQNLVNADLNDSDRLHLIELCIHLKNLKVISDDESLLNLIEGQKLSSDEIKLKVCQVLQSLSAGDISLTNFHFSLRILDKAILLSQDKNQIVHTTALNLMHCVMQLLGKSTRLMLVGDTSEIVRKNLESLLIHLFDEPNKLLLFQCLNPILESLAKLLVLLDPTIVQIIRMLPLKQLAITIQNHDTLILIFQTINILVKENHAGFIQMWSIITHFLSSDEHSIQRTLSLSILVEAAESGYYLQLLEQNYDIFFSIYKQLYGMLTEQIPDNILMKAAHEIPFIDIRQSEFEISSPRLIKTYILQFNQALSGQEYDYPFIMQKEMKRQLKFLLGDVRVLKTIFNFSLRLNTPLVESLLLNMLDHSETYVDAVIEILYQLKGNVSTDVWCKLQVHDLQQPYEQKNPAVSQIMLHSFQSSVIRNILISYVYLLQQQPYISQCSKYILLIIQKHSKKLEYHYPELMRLITVKSVDKIQYVELICALIQLIYQKYSTIDYTPLIEIARRQNEASQAIILSNIEIIIQSLKYNLGNILAIINMCKGERVTQILNQLLINHPNDEAICNLLKHQEIQH